MDFGIHEAELTPAAVAVWLVIYRHDRPDKGSSVSIEAIQGATLLCRRTIFRAIRELRTKGMLGVITKGSPDRKQATVYGLRSRPRSAP